MYDSASLMLKVTKIHQLTTMGAGGGGGEEEKKERKLQIP
jgi:hypothetical protein